MLILIYDVYIAIDSCVCPMLIHLCNLLLTLFAAAKKIPNAYLRNIIVNVVLEGNVGQKGIWGDESFCPSWWPRTIEFTSPNYRNRDGEAFGTFMCQGWKL